ncbi:hypothetical protein PR048_013557 [Dryococelus australis]|uniref:Uncharacterized protein n=1 Tax=Dryococelus australis TaxID=614101 RepID=A0ABQ9HSH9_9NEOP|nr:hypothetical protein PR048_013557 [Dryococelus australis]
MARQSIRQIFAQLDEFERGCIVGLKEAGWTFRSIARLLNYSNYTVSRCWGQWEQDGTHTNLECSGRPCWLTSRKNRFILRQGGHFMVAEDRPVSASSIFRRLAKWDLSSRHLFKMSTVTTGESPSMLDLPLETGSMAACRFRRVVSIDESRFSMDTDNHQIQVWRCSGERHEPHCIVEWHTTTMSCTIVWGNNSFDFRTTLVVIIGWLYRPVATTADLDGQFHQPWQDLRQDNIRHLYASIRYLIDACLRASERRWDKGRLVRDQVDALLQVHGRGGGFRDRGFRNEKSVMRCEGEREILETIQAFSNAKQDILREKRRILKHRARHQLRWRMASGPDSPTTRLSPGRTGFNSGGVAPEFSHVGIVPDDAAGHWAYSGIPRFTHSCCSIPTSFLPHRLFKSSILRTFCCRTNDPEQHLDLTSTTLHTSVNDNEIPQLESIRASGIGWEYSATAILLRHPTTIFDVIELLPLTHEPQNTPFFPEVLTGISYPGARDQCLRVREKTGISDSGFVGIFGNHIASIIDVFYLIHIICQRKLVGEMCRTVEGIIIIFNTITVVIVIINAIFMIGFTSCCILDIKFTILCSRSRYFVRRYDGFVITAWEITNALHGLQYSCQSLIFRLLKRLSINVHVLKPKAIRFFKRTHVLPEPDGPATTHLTSLGVRTSSTNALGWALCDNAAVYFSQPLYNTPPPPPPLHSRSAVGWCATDLGCGKLWVGIPDKKRVDKADSGIRGQGLGASERTTAILECPFFYLKNPLFLLKILSVSIKSSPLFQFPEKKTVPRKAIFSIIAGEDSCLRAKESGPGGPSDIGHGSHLDFIVNIDLEEISRHTPKNELGMRRPAFDLILHGYTVSIMLPGCRQCRFCDRVFTYGQNARRQERTACTKSPFRTMKHLILDICPMQFVQDDILKEHVEICMVLSTGSQQVFLAIPLVASIGTDSTGDYEETINAKDPMSAGVSPFKVMGLKSRSPVPNMVAKMADRKKIADGQQGDLSNAIPSAPVTPAVRTEDNYKNSNKMTQNNFGSDDSQSSVQTFIKEVTVSLLDFHQSDPGLNSRPGYSGFPYVGIVPGDAVVRRVFSEISCSPAPSFWSCYILNPITLIGSEDLDLHCSPPTKVNQVQSPAGSLRILACGNRAGRCRCWWDSSGISLFPAPSFRPCSIFAALYTQSSQNNDKLLKECPDQSKQKRQTDLSHDVNEGFLQATAVSSVRPSSSPSWRLKPSPQYKNVGSGAGFMIQEPGATNHLGCRGNLGQTCFDGTRSPYWILVTLTLTLCS